jgi:hypothetical protein
MRLRNLNPFTRYHVTHDGRPSNWMTRASSYFQAAQIYRRHMNLTGNETIQVTKEDRLEDVQEYKVSELL